MNLLGANLWDSSSVGRALQRERILLLNPLVAGSSPAYPVNFYYTRSVKSGCLLYISCAYCGNDN